MERESESKSVKLLIPVMIFMAACCLRLLGLGSASLTFNEAENAMAAYQLFDHGCNGQLLYVLPTTILFRAFGSSDFTARLVPALMGVLLSIIPFLLHQKIGFRKACLLSFLLAVDPVLLFWSKRADAVIPAIAMMGLAAAFLFNKRYTASLVCFFLSLCGGERAWPAVLSAAVGLILYVLYHRISIAAYFAERFRVRNGLFSLIFFALLCTAFGAFPGGINGFGRGFVSSFQRTSAWAFPGLNAVLAAVVLYCGIPMLIFAIDAVKCNRIPEFLIVLAVSGGLLLWQGIVMLPWISVLLWLGAADSLLRLLQRLSGPKDFPFFLSAFVILGAYAFFYFRLVELFNQKNSSDPVQITWNGTVQTLHLTRFGGTVLLTVISFLILALIVKILLGFVESSSIRRGMLCGCFVVLSWGLVTGIWNAGGFDRVGDHPLSSHLSNTASVLNGAYTSYLDTALFDLLTETIEKHGDSTNTNYGLNFIDDDPMIAWYLRNKPGIRTMANLQTDLAGIDLILDRSETSFESRGYVQALKNWRSTMDWSRFSVQDWGKWLIFGDANAVSDSPISLWVRLDYIFFLES